MSKPPIEDVIEQLPRNPSDRNYVLRRDLSGVDIIAVHYRGTYTDPSADPLEIARADARYHLQKDWSPPHGVRGFGLMYHYGITLGGRILQVQPERLVTWNATDANYRDIAIECQIGPRQTPTAAMLSALRSLLDWLCYERPDIPAGRRNVWGHGEMGGIYGGGPAMRNSTDCPGPMLDFVRAYRQAPDVPPVPAPPTPTPEPVPSRMFPQTGRTVRGAILKTFDESGGVATNGLPISDEQLMEFPGGQRLTVQWFERARLELHPDGSVTRGLVGAEALAAYKAGR